MTAERSTLLMIAQCHPEDFSRFVACEDGFTGLFDDHGLVLLHRYRDESTWTEVHVVSFERRDSLATYLADPRRTALREELDRLRVQQRVVFVSDVAVPQREG